MECGVFILLHLIIGDEVIDSKILMVIVAEV